MDARRDYSGAVLGLASLIVAERKIDIQMPSIAEIAEKLGVSRQTIYAQAEELREAAEAAFVRKRPGPKKRPAAGREEPGEAARKLLRAKQLEIEVRTYERDHDLVFAAFEGHLPQEHRSFLVRLLRNWQRRGVPKSRIAEIVGVPLENLRRWDRRADEEGRFPKKRERRGAHQKLTFGQIRDILRAYKALEGDVTLQQFYHGFNKGRKDRVSKRKIARVLEAYALRRTRKRQRHVLPPERFRVYFPGAQLAIDGKKLRIQVDQETFLVTCQAGIDIASGLFLGRVIDTEETAEGTRVVIQLSRDAMRFLSVLMDNRSGNLASVDACEGMEVGPIFTFTYRPQTNGHIEGGGGWSWVEKVVGKILAKIKIDTSSPKAIALSVAKIVMEIFTYFANRLPRKRLGGMTPLEYARTYKPTAEEVEEARRGLREQKERSERIHERTRSPEITEEKRCLIEGLCRRWGFDVEAGLKYLVWFNTDVIAEADRIYASKMNREFFEEDKKNLRYFCGIVKNLQANQDDAAENARALAQETERVKARNREAEERIKEEEAEEERQLRKRPEAVVLEYLEMLAPSRFRFIPTHFWKKIEGALRHLRRKGRAGRDRFREILAWLDLVDCDPTRREQIRIRLQKAFGEG